MFPIDMKHIGKIESVGTAQVFGYSARKVDRDLQDLAYLNYAATARFVSRSLGRATERVHSRSKRPDGTSLEPQLRQRDLMSIEEVITPPVGSSTLIHRTATTTYAAQVVLLASLTPMFQREDWAQAVERAGHSEPPVLEQPLFRRRERREPGAPADAEVLLPDTTY